MPWNTSMEPKSQQRFVLLIMTITFGIVWVYSYANERIPIGQQRVDRPTAGITPDQPALYWSVLTFLGIVAVVCLIALVLDLLGFPLPLGKTRKEVE